MRPDVIVYVCHNCVPPGTRMMRQWRLNGALVQVRQIPCSGKTDIQYLFHVLEGGGYGFCVVTCPSGECHLAQGNYRARIRVQTVQRLLGEIGLEPERVQVLESSPRECPESFERSIHAVVERICGLGPMPFGVNPLQEATR